MKRIKSNIILALLTLFTTMGCGSVADYNYTNGNQRVVIEFVNGKNYLEYGKSTKVNFNLTNIKVDDFIVVGVGVKIIGKNENTLKTEIKVSEKKRIDNILNVRIKYGENKTVHNFKMSIK